MRRSARIRERLRRDRSRSPRERVRHSRERSERSREEREIIDVSEEPEPMAVEDENKEEREEPMAVEDDELRRERRRERMRERGRRRRRERERRREEHDEERRLERERGDRFYRLTNFENIVLEVDIQVPIDVKEFKYIPGWRVTHVPGDGDNEHITIQRNVVFGEIIVNPTTNKIFYNAFHKLAPRIGSRMLPFEQLVERLGTVELVEYKNNRLFRLRNIPDEKKILMDRYFSEDPNRVTFPISVSPLPLDDIKDLYLRELRFEGEEYNIMKDQREYEWIETGDLNLKKRRFLPGELMVDENGMLWINRVNAQGIDSRNLIDWKNISDDLTVRQAPIEDIENLRPLMKKLVKQEEEAYARGKFYENDHQMHNLVLLYVFDHMRKQSPEEIFITTLRSDEYDEIPDRNPVNLRPVRNIQNIRLFERIEGNIGGSDTREYKMQYKWNNDPEGFRKRRLYPNELFVDNDNNYWIRRQNDAGIDARDGLGWKRFGDYEVRPVRDNELYDIQYSEFLDDEYDIIRQEEIFEEEKEDEIVRERLNAVSDYEDHMRWYSQEHKRPQVTTLVHSTLRSIGEECNRLSMDVIMQEDFVESDLKSLILFKIERMVPEGDKYRRIVDGFCVKRNDFLEACEGARPIYVHPEHDIRKCDFIPEEAVFKFVSFYIRDAYYVVRHQVHCQKFWLRTTGLLQYLSSASFGVSIMHSQLHPVYDIIPEGDPVRRDVRHVKRMPIFRHEPFITKERVPPEGYAEIRSERNRRAT